MSDVLFFNDTDTAENYTLSLHDAIPIWRPIERLPQPPRRGARVVGLGDRAHDDDPRRAGGEHLAHVRLVEAADREPRRSEEHTSELQSRQYLVCRLLLEIKKLLSLGLLN